MIDPGPTPQSAAALHPRVLCVDDEPYVLDGLRDVLRRSFDVRTATSGADGLRALLDEPDGYAIVLSDMRMPVMSGAEFLRRARMIAPDAVRMLLTGHADLEDAIKAVNGARLFRYLTKPCDSDELLRACAAALGYHRLHVAERLVLEQTVRGSVEALGDVLALTNPAAFGRGRRVKRLAGQLAYALGVPAVWEVEVAAMLAQVGAVILPQATADKLYSGLALTEHEAAMVQRVPAVSRGLIGKIPRLDGVLEILDGSYETHAHPDAVDPVGRAAQILRIARDYDSLESQGVTKPVALGAMASRRIYPPEFLTTLANVIGVGRAAPAIREVQLDDLAVGATLASDVVSVDGRLLVARGHPVSEQIIERLTNIGSRAVREPLRIVATSVPE